MAGMTRSRSSARTSTTTTTPRATIRARQVKPAARSRVNWLAGHGPHAGTAAGASQAIPPARDDPSVTDSTYTEIAYEVEDGVLTITLDRPERLNAFTPTMMDELIAAFDAVRRRRRRAGRGGDRPGPGLLRRRRPGGRRRDLRPGAQRAQGVFRSGIQRDGGGRVSLRIYDSKKPVIAAINGAAVGVGITMTLPMDIRLCAEDAKIGFVFARRGIVNEAASSWFLPKVVGIGQAQEWVLTGRIFNGAEALAGRLVRSIHPTDQVLPAAYELAHEIAANASPVSVALSRQMLWRLPSAEHPMEAHRIDSRAIQARGASADSREGVQSFLEKREAKFPLRVSDGMPDFYPWWDEPTFT